MRPAERVQTSKATRHLARLPRSHSLIMDGVALVTGGASGVSLIWTEITGRTSSIQIGAAIVEAFLDKGVRGVTVADIDPGAQLLEAVVDVTNEESVKEMLRRTVDRFGKLDYAVNSAGITSKSKVDEYSTEAVRMLV